MRKREDKAAFLPHSRKTSRQALMAIKEVHPFEVPRDIQMRATKATKEGVKIVLTPKEIMERMDLADKALNGESNDAEHDALYSLREWLSDIFEDPERRTKG